MVNVGAAFQPPAVRFAEIRHFPANTAQSLYRYVGGRRNAAPTRTSDNLTVGAIINRPAAAYCDMVYFPADTKQFYGPAVGEGLDPPLTQFIFSRNSVVKSISFSIKGTYPLSIR